MSATVLRMCWWRWWLGDGDMATVYGGVASDYSDGKIIKV